MDSKIDEYWNDSNNNHKKDKFPSQGVEVSTFLFECIEDDEIGQRNNYDNDNGGSSKKRYIHRKHARIKMCYANDFANLKSPLVKYLISLMPYLMAANLLIPSQKAKPDHHSAGSIPAALSTSG